MTAGLDPPNESTTLDALRKVKAAESDWDGRLTQARAEKDAALAAAKAQADAAVKAVATELDAERSRSLDAAGAAADAEARSIEAGGTAAAVEARSGGNQTVSARRPALLQAVLGDFAPR